MRILFVCTGNICRSPTAEAILRARIAAQNLPFETDSAGTHGYHIGEPADRRSVEMAAYKGVDMAALRARQVAPADFAAFDLILAMDRGHLQLLNRQCPPEYRHKVKLFLAESGRAESGFEEVPDPYYGGQEGFRAVYELIESGIDGLIAKYKSL